MDDPLDDNEWREEDAAWERLRQDALAALGTNDRPRARSLIGQALPLARTHLETGDPRLAATLACQARLLRDENPSLSAGLFKEAIAHWAQAPAWLARQPLGRPGRLARSSSFHLRLESKHPGAYRERQREELKSLLTLGRTLTGELRDARDAGDINDRDEARPKTAPLSTALTKSKPPSTCCEAAAAEPSPSRRYWATPTVLQNSLAGSMSPMPVSLNSS